GGGGGDGDGDGADAGPPRAGGTLRVGIVRVSSLDPAQARTVDQLLVADQLFDSLSAYDLATLEPVPSIASRWEASADQRNWTFFLRPDATFSNGRAITGADVKYTLERIAAKGSGSGVTDLLELVSGYRQVNEGRVAQLSGVTVPAPDQVRISLDQPWSVLPAVLGNPAFGIVPRESVEAADPGFATLPAGSGPFMVKGRSAVNIGLARAPGSKALLEAVEFVVYDSVAVSYRAFAEGKLDWSQLPAEQVDPAGAGPNPPRGAQRSATPFLAELFYGFNLRNPKYADIRFREAIIRAVNRQAIIAAVYGTTVRPIDGILVEGVPGRVADVCGERCRYDPGRARELVAEAFAGRAVPEVVIDFDDDQPQAAVARALKANLAEVGIPAALRGRSSVAYDLHLTSGDQELFRLGWFGAYPSADAFLPALFAGGSPSNLTGFRLAAVDDKLKAARSERDAGRRQAIYQEVERTIIEQLPVLPIAQFESHAIATRQVRDLAVTANGTFDASRVWLASG
ncbi:MAG: ABC transporter substrate-binding protein, partial [Acidimicrobiales bacterium]